MTQIKSLFMNHCMHLACNAGECNLDSEGGVHGGELIGFNSNLNFKQIDKRIIDRIESETGSHVRFAAGRIRVKEFSFLQITLYLKCSVGMDGCNDLRMKQVSILVAIVGLPFLIVGDFNMTSTQLLNTGWPQHLKCTPRNISSGTTTLRYHQDRRIDFALVSNDMLGMVAEFDLSPAFPCTPHYACEITFHGTPRDILVPMMRIPHDLPLAEFKQNWRRCEPAAKRHLLLMQPPRRKAF